MSAKKPRHKVSGKSAKHHKPKKPRKADTADKYELYEKSVQSTEFEYEFIDENFKRIRGRTAKTLREDFCGTAQMCCEWVRGRKENRAVGVDFDPEVLAWSRDHHLAALHHDLDVGLILKERDILGGIAGDDQKIGILADLDRPDLSRHI